MPSDGQPSLTRRSTAATTNPPDLREFLPGITYLRDSDTFTFRDSVVPSRPISLCIHASTRCNLTCSYCLSSSGPTSPRGLGQLSTLLPRLEPWFPLRVVWSGGEPLLEHAELLPLAVRLHAEGCVQILTTNGTFRPPEALLGIVDWFDVSIHGTSADGYVRTTNRNVFERVLRTVETLVQNGVKVSSSAVLTRENLDELPRLASRLHGIGVERFRVSRLLPLGRGACVTAEDVSDEEASALDAVLRRQCPGLTVISPAVRKRTALLTGYFVLENDGTFSSPPSLAGIHISDSGGHPAWPSALRDQAFLFNGVND